METDDHVLGCAAVWAVAILSAALFFVLCLLNQYRNNVKANKKNRKDQKESFYDCKHGV
ncbi:hypothetical protein JE617_000293 [Salmonella enterica]|uniref:hypothetical protein n=1 Tax=Salmonella enterica TaxID=28901 RepID=UPI001D250D5F|nr:hypothetical protein [Salmonella enterica subsp. diarizonae]EDW9100991.1 hypothetical protein [Salmonella enterica subsp. diarizonae]EEA3034866.1 hypothetical protein [Salmonella enterica subsp. diarizonae]EGT7823481.1 hypothetical protein [Salmonella enterica]